MLQTDWIMPFLSRNTAKLVEKITAEDTKDAVFIEKNRGISGFPDG